MATNEDLAVAFLCMCDNKDREEVLQIVEYSLSSWDDKENKERILEALRLPTSFIQRKIALLHTGLYQCPKKKLIYEEMANRLANMTATLRSPILKPRSERSALGPLESTGDYVMPISLYSNQSSKE
jgi:hypothetical protein